MVAKANAGSRPSAADGAVSDMNQLVPISSPALPALVTAAGERASMRFFEFFAANIRNPHTRRAYYRQRALDCGSGIVRSYA